MASEINNKESLDDADEIDNDNPVRRDKEKAKAKTNNRNIKTIGNDEDKNEEDDDVDETENRKNNVKTKTRKKNVKSIKNDDQENEEKQDIDEDGDVDEIDGRRKKRYILHEEDQHNDDVEAAEDAEIKKPANSLAAKKTLAQGMMDIALITANANQLRYMVEYNQHSSTFYINVILISVSLILQLLIGMTLIFKTWLYMQGKSKKPVAKKLNIYVTAGVFAITIINVFIASFTVTGPAPVPGDKR